MHCDRARDALLERLDRPLEESTAAELDQHLKGCGECRVLAADLAALEAQARVWHDLTPPRWNPAGETAPGLMGGRAAGDWRAVTATWFPTLASAAALLLALSVFFRGPGPASAPPAAELTERTVAPPVEQVLAATRQERQAELEALTTLIKAEMDRRSLETEESLKYVISHQIQSQRQLESIRSRLEPEAPTASEQL